MDRSQLIAQIKTFIFFGFIRISLHNYMYMNSEREFQYYCFVVAKQFSIPGFYSVRLTHLLNHDIYPRKHLKRKKNWLTVQLLQYLPPTNGIFFSLPLKVISPVHVACCLFSCRSETSKSWLVIVFREKCSERDIK